MEVVQDSSKYSHKSFIVRNKHNVTLWSGLFVVVVFSYHLLSDGDFSFLLTFGSFVRAFAFAVLVFKAFVQHSVAGLSFKTIQLYILVFIFRLSSILRYQGYLPFDSSGDWLYSFSEICGFSLAGVVFYQIMFHYKNTYEVNFDTFGSLYVPSEFGAIYVIAPAFLLALLFHPNLNMNWLADFAWTFALYMEAGAIIPQLYMFQKRGGGAVESCISQFVYGLAFASFLNLWFWLFSYHELGDKHAGEHVGYLVIIVQIANMVVMADFLYFYFKSLKQGGPMMLPTHGHALA